MLSTGRFVAIGESLPYMPVPFSKERLVSRVEAVENMLRIAEVADKHKVVLRYHTGLPMGYTGTYSFGRSDRRTSIRCDAHDIAAAFPDLTLVFDHGGIQAWWWERFTRSA